MFPVPLERFLAFFLCILFLITTTNCAFNGSSGNRYRENRNPEKVGYLSKQSKNESERFLDDSYLKHEYQLNQLPSKEKGNFGNLNKVQARDWEAKSTQHSKPLTLDPNKVNFKPGYERSQTNVLKSREEDNLQKKNSWSAAP